MTSPSPAAIPAAIEIDPVVVVQAFHPVEAAIVRIALGLPPEPGDAELDIWNNEGKLPEGVTHLEPAKHADLARSASDVLARLVLAGFEETLPTWATVRDGEFVTSRKERGRRKRPVRALPMHLFTINWASSGPGFDWPEAYHFGWLPGFNRWVVTGSRDSPEVDGYCDRAIATFEPCDDPVAEACWLIQKDWSTQKAGWDQERWEFVIDSGRVSEDEATALADEVWHEDEDEDKGDEDEDEASSEASRDG